jgi:hypothetical protein
MVARSNTVAGWEGSMEIRVDKKKLKVKGQQPPKKKKWTMVRTMLV